MVTEYKNQWKGFILCSDRLIRDYGLITAAVFGKVYAYCEMRDGFCWASVETMANELGVSFPTIIKHLKILVRDKYLEKEEKPGRTSTYKLTGKLLYEMTITEKYEDYPPETPEPIKMVNTPIKMVNTPIKMVNTSNNNKDNNKDKNIAPKNGAGGATPNTGEPPVEEWFSDREKVVPPRPPRTAESVRAGVAQALRDNAERQANGHIDLSWLGESLRPLAAEFITCAGAQYAPIKSERSKWRKILQEWQDIGITTDQISQAVDYMRKSNLTIGGPESITKIARDKIGVAEHTPVVPKFRANRS